MLKFAYMEKLNFKSYPLRIKNNEIRDLSDAELVHAELQLQRDIVDERMIIDEENKSSDAMFFRKIRRTIARLRTEQRRREIEQGHSKDYLRTLHRNTFAYEKKTESSLQSLESLSKDL